VIAATATVLACQNGDGQQRHPDHGHGVAAAADRLADPQQPEVALPQQAGGPAYGACARFRAFDRARVRAGDAGISGERNVRGRATGRAG
jgi:hypothetical protein